MTGREEFVTTHGRALPAAASQSRSCAPAAANKRGTEASRNDQIPATILDRPKHRTRANPVGFARAWGFRRHGQPPPHRLGVRAAGLPGRSRRRAGVGRAPPPPPLLPRGAAAAPALRPVAGSGGGVLSRRRRRGAPPGRGGARVAVGLPRRRRGRGQGLRQGDGGGGAGRAGGLHPVPARPGRAPPPRRRRRRPRPFQARPLPRHSRWFVLAANPPVSLPFTKYSLHSRTICNED